MATQYGWFLNEYSIVSDSVSMVFIRCLCAFKGVIKRVATLEI